MTINIDTFPCPETERLYKAGCTDWVETSEKHFYYFLEVLPPIRMRANAFMVGECYTHDDKQGAIYDTCVEVDNRYFIRLAALRSFDPAEYTRQVKAQFNIN